MDKKFICNICVKNYKSYQSLWNHNKKFHTQISTISDKISTISDKISTISDKISTNLNEIDEPIPYKLKKTEKSECNYCKKNLSCYKSLKRHEKICKSKQTILDDTSNSTNINELQKLNDMLVKENNDIKQLLNEIIKNPKKSNNIQKINTNNINNGTINNTNNITIIALGNEKLNELLTTNEQLNILNKKNTCILSLIKYAHFNKTYPNLHSIILSNYKSNTLYLYDDESKIFKLTNKEEAIDLLIENKVCDIEDFYLAHKDKLDTKTKKIIETIIEDRYENDEKDTLNKKMREDVNLLLYNNRNTVKYLLK